MINGQWNCNYTYYCVRVKAIEIDRSNNRTFIELDIYAKQSKDWAAVPDNYPTLSGDGWYMGISDFCGYKLNDGTIEQDHYSKGWKQETGEERKHVLVFNGVIPRGKTKIELNLGYNQTYGPFNINNPCTGTSSWTDQKIRSHSLENNDGICGIYQSTNGNGHIVGCIRTENKYWFIHLSGKDKWCEGDIQAKLTESATTGVFMADWYTDPQRKSKYSYLAMFDGAGLRIFSDNHDEYYIKMYPTTSAIVSKQVSETEIALQEWTGTGFALNNGYIVTNYHVIDGARSIYIRGINGNNNTSYLATVVAADFTHDLAIVKIRSNNFRGFGALPYSIKTQSSEVGDEVFVLGYPLTETMGNEIKLTNGIISSRSGFQNDQSLYQMSAPVQPGNSGGPMFDSKGNVVGVVSAHHKGAENVGYAIKTSYLKALIDSSGIKNVLPAYNTVSHLNLSGKVKKLKNYVYQIDCTNKSHPLIISKGGEKVLYSPQATKNYENLIINSIRLTNSYTALEIRYNMPEEGRNEDIWRINIFPNTYINIDGKHYKITRAENIAYHPNDTYVNQRDIIFTLYFPPIPMNTKQIDMIEPEGDFTIIGIKLQ